MGPNWLEAHTTPRVGEVVFFEQLLSALFQEDLEEGASAWDTIHHWVEFWWVRIQPGQPVVGREAPGLPPGRTQAFPFRLLETSLSLKRFWAPINKVKDWEWHIWESAAPINLDAEYFRRDYKRPSPHITASEAANHHEGQDSREEARPREEAQARGQAGQTAGGEGAWEFEAKVIEGKHAGFWPTHK